MKVLVVEDHADTAHVLELSLSARGIDIETAHDADTALARCAAGQFDVLVVDIRLGSGMDGCELLHELRKAGCDTPAIALTADAYTTDINRCLEAGFVRHVAKPTDIEELVKVMREVQASPA